MAHLRKAFHFKPLHEVCGISRHTSIIVNASSSEKETVQAIGEGMRRLKSASYAVLGKEDVVKLLEGKGSQADFMEFVQYVDNEVAKSINGSTLSSNAGKTGSLALGQVHEANRYEITAKDANLQDVVFKKHLKRLVLMHKFPSSLKRIKTYYKERKFFKLLQDKATRWSLIKLQKSLICQKQKLLITPS